MKLYFTKFVDISMNMSEIDQQINDVYVFKLVRTAQAFKQYAIKRLATHGVELTSDQWILLKRVSEYPGITQRQLASDVFKDPASVTRILDVLSKKGLIDRRTGDDRRLFNIYLTEKSELIVNKGLSAAVEIRQKGLEGLTKAEETVFIKALDKVFENFKM